MKEVAFSVIWAAICAWICTQILVWIDLTRFSFFLGIANQISQWGFSPKVVCFLFFAVLFLATGTHKLLGTSLRIVIGWAGLIISFILILVICWYVVKWLISCL